MRLTLYNTLSGKKEEFQPIEPGKVRMYNCGPTVYNFAHIGNLRAYVFADVLRRALEFNGYAVTQVMNITDVGQLTSDADEGEDKMVKALIREKKPMTLESMREVAEMYFREFTKDIGALNIETPAHMPFASDHIAEAIELIMVLLQKGFAYKAANGVYFDISKFPSYGKLGNIPLQGLKAGARVWVNPEKKNPGDFTLWKLAGQGLPAFQSPLGPGFPGWHIECSAMSRTYLGQPFDIHTGGIDHIPTHHQNEIAQSEAAYGAPLANYWMHNEHLVLPEGKMAKSGGNFITLQTLRNRNIHPLAYRYYLLGGHYRTPMNFNVEAVEAANRAYYRLLHSFLSFGGVSEKASGNYGERFLETLNDDLDTPVALSQVWGVIKDETLAPAHRRWLIAQCDRVLGFDIERQAKEFAEQTSSVPGSITTLAQKREELRRAKHYAEADSVRWEIQSQGYEVIDTDTGPIVKRAL